MAFDPKTTTNQPAHFQTKALWDTGASNSVIAKSLVAKLGLLPVGQTTVHTGGTNSVSVLPTYIVNLLLPNNVGFAGVMVTEFDPQHNGFEVLIGMDIINKGDLAITHVGGKSCMSFRLPTCQQIDFVAMGKAQQAKVPIKKDPKIGRNDPCPCGSMKTDGTGPMKYKNCHG